MKTESKPLVKRFLVSYAGEAEYEIGGRAYSARYHGSTKASWNGDYFETGIKPSIGCVRYRDSDRWSEFPPAEVVALFPGFVGQRLVYHPACNLPITHPDFQLGTMEYICDGPAPTLAPHPACPDYLTTQEIIDTGEYDWLKGGAA